MSFLVRVPAGTAEDRVPAPPVIELTPHLEIGHGGAPVHYDRFESRLDGRLLCASRQPFLDSARVLLAEGWDPATSLVARRAGSTANSLRGPIGMAAKLDINGSATGFTRRARRPQGEGTGPPAALNDLPQGSTPDKGGGAP